MIKEQKLTSSLTPYEKFEAEITAFEAAQTYWFLRSRQESGRPVEVIGNQRYGKLFVIEPLEQLLKEVGISYTYPYIRSTSALSTDIQEVFEDQFVKKIITNSPDIVIVDGATRSFYQGYTRYPKSMYAFLNWFLAFDENLGDGLHSIAVHRTRLFKENPRFMSLERMLRDQYPNRPEHQLSFWNPSPTDKILMGESSITLPFIYPSSHSPHIIFANPVSDPQTAAYPIEQMRLHTPAYFDDPEKKRTPTSNPDHPQPLELAKKIRTCDQFIAAVQTHIRNVLPEFLDVTKP